MTVMIQMLKEESRGIHYRQSWARVVGPLPALFLQQVWHRWENNENKPFYKLNAPCKHPLYREGDSWEEELAFSRRQLETARSVVAIKKDSDTSMQEARQQAREDKKPVIYWTDRGRMTHYTIDMIAFESLLEDVYKPTPPIDYDALEECCDDEIDNAHAVQHLPNEGDITNTKITKELVLLSKDSNTKDDIESLKTQEPEELDSPVEPNSLSDKANSTVPTSAARTNKGLTESNQPTTDVVQMDLLAELSLKPTTEGQEHLFAAINRNRIAKGRRAIKQFGSLEVKEKFSEAEGLLPPEHLKRAVFNALSQEITSLPRIVSYVLKIAQNQSQAHRKTTDATPYLPA